MQEQETQIVKRVAKLEERVDVVEKGFPDGDIAGHARYHQMVMDEYLEKRRIRQAVVEQVVKGSVWALLLAAAGAVWTYIKEHMFK